MLRHLILGAAVALAACSGPSNPLLSQNRVPPGDSTGLVGTVTRGPITPVCRVGVTCDAPFAASFTVMRGQVAVARFQSDTAGRYEVLLSPGAYTVTPDSGSPVFPNGQAKAATVGPVGLTRLDLQFDTGIR